MRVYVIIESQGIVEIYPDSAKAFFAALRHYKTLPAFMELSDICLEPEGLNSKSINLKNLLAGFENDIDDIMTMLKG